MKTSQKIILTVTAVLLSIGGAVAVTGGGRPSSRKSSGGGNKSKLPIIVCVAVIAALAMGAALWFFLSSDDAAPFSAELIDSEAGEYMLTGVPREQSFNISVEDKSAVSESDFAVTDINGEVVATSLEWEENAAELKAPEGGYEDGEVYFLDLNGKGTFNEKEFSDAKKVIFTTQKENTKKIVYTDNVHEVNGSEVTVTAGGVTVKGRYEDGDVIVSDTDGDNIDEIYKLENVRLDGGNTVAELGEPTPDEIYEDIDIFYIDSVNMEEAQLDTDAFTGTLKEAGILDAFIDSAYAEEDVDTEVTVMKGAEGVYSFTVTIKDPADKNRQLKIKFAVKDKLLVKIDKKTAIFDNTVTLIDSIEISVKGEGKEEAEEKIKSAIKNYEAGKEDVDKSSRDLPLLPIKVPVAGPIGVSIEIGLTADLEYSAEINVGAEAQLSLKKGVIYNRDKHKITRTYGDVTGGIDAHVMVQGELNAFAGAYVNASLEAMPILKAGLEGTGGPYLEARGCFVINGIPKNVKTEGYYKTEIGLLFRVNCTFKAFMFKEKTYELAEKKKPLYQYSDYLDLQDVSIADEYDIADGGVDLGELTASYLDLTTGKTVKRPIEDYKLLLDGKKVAVEDGRLNAEVGEGSHKLSLTFTEEGKEFSFEKEFKARIDYFSLLFEPQIIFEKYSPQKHGSRIVMEYADDFDAPVSNKSPSPQWWYSDKLNVRFTEGRISATAKQIFGLEEKMDLKSFNAQNGIGQLYGIGEDFLSFRNSPAKIDYYQFGLLSEEVPKGLSKTERHDVYDGQMMVDGQLVSVIAMISDDYVYPETILALSTGSNKEAEKYFKNYSKKFDNDGSAWKNFENVNNLGLSVEEIDSKYGKSNLQTMGASNGVSWTKVKSEDLYYDFRYGSMWNAYEPIAGQNDCFDTAGTAGKIFGKHGDMSIDDFGHLLGIDFQYEGYEEGKDEVNWSSISTIYYLPQLNDKSSKYYHKGQMIFSGEGRSTTGYRYKVYVTVDDNCNVTDSSLAAVNFYGE